MAENLKVGDRVRARGRDEIGTVAAIGATVELDYEYRAGTVTKGYFPPENLDLVPDEEPKETTP
jgi:hypothetical protein